MVFLFPDGFNQDRAEYISLGYNCEVAFQLQRSAHQNASSFFDWGIFELESICYLIENRFAKILLAENLEWDSRNSLFFKRLFRYSFHGPWLDGNPSDDSDFYCKLDIYRNKCMYLSNRFLNPDRPRVYFYKNSGDVSPHLVVRIVKLLQDISSNFHLVLLRNAEQRILNINSPIVYERILNRFAPEGNARDSHVASWNKVLTEFMFIDK